MQQSATTVKNRKMVKTMSSSSSTNRTNSSTNSSTRTNKTNKTNTTHLLNPVQSLPLELLHMIMQWLPLHSLIHTCHCCRSWRLLLYNCPSLWSKLDLSHHHCPPSPSSRSLEWLAHRSRHALRSLTIGPAPHLTPTSLSPFCQYRLPLLSTLVLSCNSRIPGSSLLKLVRAAPNLSSLCLAGMGLLDPISLRQILLTSTHLKTLDLGDCTALTSSAFVGLDKMQSKMTHLRLAGCSITDAVVESLLPYWCDSLRSIDLSRCRLLSRHTLLHMASFKLLEIIKINSLNLSQPKDLSMDDAFLILAEGCPLLTSISMRNCPDLTSQCLIYIMQLCDSLHTIHIPGSARVNDAFLSSLLNDLVACRIIDLDISRCPGFTLPAILSLFRELSSLKSLVASGSPCMTDDGVQLLLATADSLEHLDLSLCPNIRGTGLVRGLHGHLRSIPVHCLTLNIASNPQISAETVAYLKQTLGVGRVVSRIGS